MAKSTMCKCRYCKKEIEKDKAYSVKQGQYYCNENHYLSAQEKKRQGNDLRFKPSENTDRRRLTDYVQDLYIQEGWNKNKINWSLIMQNAKRILDNHPNWTYDTLIYVMNFEQNILGLNLITKESNYSPFALIEYHWKDAENYWEECADIQKAIDQFNFDENVVIVKKSTKTSNKRKEIDMSSLDK